MFPMSHTCRSRGGQVGSVEGPADLDEIDPTLGAWLPSGAPGR